MEAAHPLVGFAKEVTDLWVGVGGDLRGRLARLPALNLSKGSDLSRGEGMGPGVCGDLEVEAGHRARA